MIQLRGLKILYAMNYDKEFEAFELSYAENEPELQRQFQKMINAHPDCVVKHALVFQEYTPDRKIGRKKDEKGLLKEAEG